jgi:hypothetical protein
MKVVELETGSSSQRYMADIGLIIPGGGLLSSGIGGLINAHKNW